MTAGVISNTFTSKYAIFSLKFVVAGWMTAMVAVPEPYIYAIYTLPAAVPIPVPVPVTRISTTLGLDDEKKKLADESVLFETGGVSANEPSDVILFKSSRRYTVVGSPVFSAGTWPLNLGVDLMMRNRIVVLVVSPIRLLERW